MSDTPDRAPQDFPATLEEEAMMSEPKSKSIKASPQHSPLPWRSKENTHTIFCDVNGTSIGYVNHPNADEKRELIVQAVNAFHSHEVAREMAHQIADYEVEKIAGFPCFRNNHFNQILELARQYLAKEEE